MISSGLIGVSLRSLSHLNFLDGSIRIQSWGVKLMNEFNGYKGDGKMEKLTDWLELWKELVTMKIDATGSGRECRDKRYWRRKAEKFSDDTGTGASDPDSSREFIASKLADNPGSTLLDIGAGIGDWAAFLSPFARKITALEPSEAMGDLLLKTIAAAKVDNVRLVQGCWPGIDIEPHDYTLASHSMYGETDLKPFIEKMVGVSRRGCFVVTKVLFIDSIMARASQEILGQPYDSPCFQVMHNALLQMGIYPDVLMETGKKWKTWSSDSLDAALEETKRRLSIQGSSRYDDFLLKLLTGGLTEEDGKLIWPPGNGSALIYWDV